MNGAIAAIAAPSPPPANSAVVARSAVNSPKPAGAATGTLLAPASRAATSATAIGGLIDTAPLAPTFRAGARVYFGEEECVEARLRRFVPVGSMCRQRTSHG